MTKKNVPRKNYVILVGLIILTVCACFAAYNLFSIYQDNKISTSPLTKNQILYDELKSATLDLNADTFLVISYTQDKKVYNNEKDIKKLLNKKNLMDNVVYLDITKLKNDENILKDINNTLKLSDKLQIKSFPAVVYYSQGNPIYTADSTDHLLNSGDFDQIIEMYDLAS